MDVPFLGSEAAAVGTLPRGVLRSRYAAVYPNVYLPNGVDLSAVTRAKAAWLWSRRQGVVAGQSAALSSPHRHALPWTWRAAIR